MSKSKKNIKNGTISTTVQEVNQDRYDFHTFGICDEMADSPLATTNYFRTDRAKKGFILLLRKCDNYHLIVPPLAEETIDEILTGKYAQVCYGTPKTIISFDDLSRNPMAVYFDSRQISGMFDDAYDKPKRKGFLAIYKKGEEHPDELDDEVVEVGRMDLWVNRILDTNPYKIRGLTTEEQDMYI